MPKTKRTQSDRRLARALLANRRWAERLGWRPHADAIALLVSASDGETALAIAVAKWQKRHALVADGIIGPKTWAAMKVELGADVLPEVPPVPVGFDAVLDVFGDPRPLQEPDGTMTEESEEVWQRQILSRGRLPFDIQIPGGGVKRTFHAHRLLVGLFEAVFFEIARLGLEGEVQAWGGIYNFRPIRGARRRLSLHSFGAAIDLNPETNGLGTEGDMSPRLVEVLSSFGFTWGGDFRRPDPMHFQYAKGC